MAKAAKKDPALTPEEKLAQALVPVTEKVYLIPDNWRWVKLQTLSQIRTGKKDANYGSLEGQYPFFTCASEPIRCCGYSFEGKAILLAGNGDLSNISLYEGKFEAYQRTYVLNINPMLSTEYFFYYCKYRWVDYNVDKMFGTTIPYIRLGNLQGFPIPLPPLAEQQRIVDRIESLFAKLDEAKEKAQAVVDGFEDRKAAILHKAFTGELTNCKEELRTVHITDIIRHDKNALKAGPFGSALRKDMYVGSGYKIYGQEQVINGDERIGDYYIDEEKYQELIACKITPGDVLISLVGTVGKVLVLSEDCKPGIINPRLIKVSLDESKMLPLFFKYYFESGYLKNLYKSESHGTTMDVLNMGIMKRLPFPLVKIETQKEIIEILNNILEKEEQAKKVAEQVIDQIDAIKKSILSRAFRGELGTNDPTDESTEELLKRIL